MLIAVLTLAGALISLYLLLTHLGLSSLACPIGGCEVVQSSKYALFLGVPVAAFGLAYFLLVLLAAILALSSDQVFGLRAQPLLVALTALGVLPYLPLTYLELLVLHAICMWCVITSLLMLGALGAAVWGQRD